MKVEFSVPIDSWDHLDEFAPDDILGGQVDGLIGTMVDYPAKYGVMQFPIEAVALGHDRRSIIVTVDIPAQYRVVRPERPNYAFPTPPLVRERC